MSNKNQHFVSQAYLRWFGIPRENEDPKAINLFAIKTQKAVRDASIKHQCSGDYFYGRDKPIEDFLQFFEGRYGAAMASLTETTTSTAPASLASRATFLREEGAIGCIPRRRT